MREGHLWGKKDVAIPITKVHSVVGNTVFTTETLSELAAPLKFEGHPILWYAALWAGVGAIGESWVLKLLSVAAAVRTTPI